MTVQTDLAAPRTDGVSSTHEETPWDYRTKPGPLSRMTTHRFPAATYLHRNVARDERAFARQVLAATGRSIGRRVGGLSALVLGLFAALLFMVASGRTTTSIEMLTLWALGAVMAVAIAFGRTVPRLHPLARNAWSAVLFDASDPWRAPKREGPQRR